MLVHSKTSDDPTVLVLQDPIYNSLRKYRQKLDTLPVDYYRKKTKNLFSPAWLPFSGIIPQINASDADIVHLHWISGGMLRIEDISRIKKPIVWSLHDMWAFTGGCHYDCECGKYILHCGACPVLGSKKRKDLSYRVFERKIKTFGKIPNLTVVGLSRWLEECAKNSVLFAKKSIVNLPNPIDTQAFKPLERHIARDLLDLPVDKKLVLFWADNSAGDSRKGFTELSDAIRQIKSENVELVMFGSDHRINNLYMGFPTHQLGYLPGDHLLRNVYSAADVMVVPSLQENLSNTIMESLSCGTPVVSFYIGGNSDLIEHQTNGFLAKPFDTADLAEGIDWVLNHPASQELSKNARQSVMENFEAIHVARQYQDLYKMVLEDKDQKQ
jgi:glycosyltransferase involved in cell wall biosynthesis